MKIPALGIISKRVSPWVRLKYVEGKRVALDFVEKHPRVPFLAFNAAEKVVTELTHFEIVAIHSLIESSMKTEAALKNVPCKTTMDDFAVQVEQLGGRIEVGDIMISQEMVKTTKELISTGKTYSLMRDNIMIGRLLLRPEELIICLSHALKNKDDLVALIRYVSKDVFGRWPSGVGFDAKRNLCLDYGVWVG
ncbi:MAG: hypothetical protein HQ564_01735 [Candidatus Saganbacteria bacterium]|nr:hypothetical protein [Candidatus Saganbacteria bacterium]